MSNIEINGQSVGRTTFVPLASDDRVWLYETKEAKDLADLVANPYEWIKRIKVLPAKGAEEREAILSDNFVISVDVATGVDKNQDHDASYVIDGIDSTGYIAVRMMTAGGRFQFKGPFDWDKIRKEVLEGDHEFTIAKAGERAFVHLHLGVDPELRAAMLCAAIENQDWLCDLYNELDLQELDENGEKCGHRKLTFKLPGVHGGDKFLGTAPRLNVIVQGNKATVEDVDACNANSGYLYQDTYYMDTYVIKAYEPLPPAM